MLTTPYIYALIWFGAHNLAHAEHPVVIGELHVKDVHHQKEQVIERQLPVRLMELFLTNSGLGYFLIILQSLHPAIMPLFL